VTLAERLRSIANDLPAGWSEAHLVLTVADEARVEQATMTLAPLGPGRTGTSFRLRITPTGSGGASVEAAARVLARLDEAGIDVRLALPGPAAVELAPVVAAPAKIGLAESWDGAVASLPADWSDLYAELELASSADLDRAALLLGPVNPFLHGGAKPVLRFRSARRFGYGAAPEMTRRALARLDEEPIAGTLRILRVQSAISPVATQGPVWREGGRAI